MNHTGNAEIIQIVESVSRERGIPKAKLIEALEQAVEIAGRKKYGLEHNINAVINSNTGGVSLYRLRKVVDKLEDSSKEIILKDAILINPNIKIGENLADPLPPIDLGRISAQIAKQVIVQRINEIEKLHEYEEYKNRVGDILQGTVTRIEFNNIIVEIGRAEALLKKDQQIAGETFKVNDRIKALVQNVKFEIKGPQIFLSRTDDNFLKKLLELEIPEVSNKVIEIKALARDPGSKAKIAVFAVDSNVDAVGSCVGIRGNRIKSITNELRGEKIDVILWDRNIAQFVINAMTPATITKIVFDEKRNKVQSIVPNNQLSLAIGRKGQNVKLASKITGCWIDVLTEEQEQKKRSQEFKEASNLFVQSLDIEEVIAQLLAAEGYTAIEQIAGTDSNILVKIEGFNLELVKDLKTRAINYIEKQNKDIISKLEKLGVSQDLIDILELPAEYIVKLAEYGIKNLEDLEEITFKEFREVVPTNIITNDSINDLINNIKKLNKNEKT